MMPSNWAGFQGFTVIAGLFSHLYQSFPCWSPVPGMLWGKATAVGSGGIRDQELGSERLFVIWSKVSQKEKNKYHILMHTYRERI